MSNIVTIEKAHQVTGYTRQAIYDILARGDLETHTITKVREIKAVDLDELIKYRLAQLQKSFDQYKELEGEHSDSANDA